MFFNDFIEIESTAITYPFKAYKSIVSNILIKLITITTVR